MSRNFESDSQSIEELQQIEQDSKTQSLPEQPQVFVVSKRFSKLHNLPDQIEPPIGYEPGRGYDNAFPFAKLPFLQPKNPDDHISFGFGSDGFLDEKKKQFPFNSIFFGDNLQVLRNLPSNSIDLIYIDPPFFSGRDYNQIWGDNNELRTFSDIWDGGLPTYLIWLNARLWEMKRVLKTTGSIYIHLDWHAVHYVKTEMDKIFGYDNFKREIIWSSDDTSGFKSQAKNWIRAHDTILFYVKDKNNYIFNSDKAIFPHKLEYIKRFKKKDKDGRKYRDDRPGGRKQYLDSTLGKRIGDVWDDIMSFQQAATSSEFIGYPTQKPESLLTRIIEVSTTEESVVADFFSGGGSTLAACQKLGRRFIGCDISRVAISVTLDRLIKDGEEMTGNTVSNSKTKKPVQGKLMPMNVPDIAVYYHGIYPVDKFSSISQEEFNGFILTCFGASKNTVKDGVTGFKQQFQPVLVGPVNPEQALEIEDVKNFVKAVIARHVQKNQRYTLLIIAWQFDPKIRDYKKQLQKTFFKKLKDAGLLVELELIPIKSKKFRERIATNYGFSDEDKEKLLQFVEPPIIMDILAEKVEGKKSTYRFEVLGKCLTKDGSLINCQWNFANNKTNKSDGGSPLNRKKIQGDGFIADLMVEKKFNTKGAYKVSCRIQDCFGGEASKAKQITIKD